MKLSIRVRTIILFNLVLVCIVLAMGWQAERAAGTIVEERLSQEMADGTARVLEARKVSLNNMMMRDLRAMFNAEFIAVRARDTSIVGSSIAADQTGDFLKAILHADDLNDLEVNGVRYRVYARDMRQQDYAAARQEDYRLYMIAPKTMFGKERELASSRLTTMVIFSAAIATIAGLLLSLSITSPLSRLARQMDHLADQAESNGSANSSDIDRDVGDAPSEIMRLRKSFHHLIARLDGAKSALARNERLATLGKVCLSVVHELRNPLSGLKMNLRLLKDDSDGGAGQINQVADTLMREIDRMDLYLQELVSFSVDPGDAAAVAGKAQDRSRCEVCSLADSVLTIMAGRLRHAKITVERKYNSSGAEIVANATKVRQVIMNYVVNAMEAMPNGGNMLIESSARDGKIRLSVCDQGGGVRCGADEDIFDAFITSKPNGVGLGLYLCKKIITAHGGQVGYHNSAVGATFWFELPIATEQSAVAGAGPQE